MGIKERKQKEKALRRWQIQEAAKGLFIEKGLVGTTIEDIANKAELSPATIYQYFKDKDDLYVSLNFESLQYLLNQVEKIYKNKKLTLEKKMHRFKDSMYKAFQSDPRLFKNVLQFQLVSDFKSLNKEQLSNINELYQKILSMIAGIYQEGVHQGEFKDMHAMIYADIVFGIFVGLMLWEDAKKRINPKKDFFKSTLDKAFDIIIQGVKVSSSE